MNQTDLARSIAKRFFLTQVESGEIINFILSKITEDLKMGERVYFRGFGSFAKEKRSSKNVRHPKTGKIITIPERTTVNFEPSVGLIDEISDLKTEMYSIKKATEAFHTGKGTDWRSVRRG